MIDLFTIFSKGGIVLWCFQSTGQVIAPSVNALIRSVFLQERSDSKASFTSNGQTLKFFMDNEFDLVFVTAYQSIIQLSYVDKLLSDVQRLFRDRYKNILSENNYLTLSSKPFRGFKESFESCLQALEENALKPSVSAKMKTFEESLKSQKTVASMIKQPQKENGAKKDEAKPGKKEAKAKEELKEEPPTKEEEDEIAKNRAAFIAKQSKPNVPSPKQSKTEKPKEKKTKQARNWNAPIGGVEYSKIDYTEGKPSGEKEGEPTKYLDENREFVGKMKGELQGLETDSSEEVSSEESDSEEIEKTAPRRGFFSAFKSLVGSKKLSSSDVAPVLDKMREHLIAKNVASEIADKLCLSVSSKLEGKVIGTFSGVTNTVKESIRESLVQLLSPQRRVNILRDIIEAKKQNKPFVIVFCGVNGVGKSTNLAKITFWLNENGHRVLIAACDTFRAGAVEQLRTHARALNTLHPNCVELYEQGYGKDAAGVAAQAISRAVDMKYDVVLVDTAGRMQDNEPLMRSLAKLIKVNEPDLVLFVGEALVGNEAVDQLVKFNQALADFGGGEKGRLIDGIVLTKFDTIDDKVGAAISMTYVTGQPICFVGTGQSYRDLRALNAGAVVQALLK